MKNPFSGHKILRYVAYIKRESGWYEVYGHKKRKIVERNLKNTLIKGQWLFSRIRLVDNVEYREDIYEIAKC